MVRLRIDMGAYLYIRKLNWGLNWGGGGGIPVKAQGGEQKFLVKSWGCPGDVKPEN